MQRAAQLSTRAFTKGRPEVCSQSWGLERAEISELRWPDMQCTLKGGIRRCATWKMILAEHLNREIGRQHSDLQRECSWSAAPIYLQCLNYAEWLKAPDIAFSKRRTESGKRETTGLERAPFPRRTLWLYVMVLCVVAYIESIATFPPDTDARRGCSL